MVLRGQVTAGPGSEGSLGATNRIKATNSHRVRGFSTTPLIDERTKQGLIEMIHNAQREAREKARLEGEAVPTRTKVRALVESGFRANHIRDRLNGQNVESVFSLGHIHGFQGFEVINFGGNAVGRRPNTSIHTKMLRANAKTAAQVAPEDPETLLRNVRSRGYTLERLEASVRTEQDLEDLYILYTETFTGYMYPISRSLIASLNNNNNNVFMIVRNENGRIIGALIGEYATTEIAGQTLQMCELSDFAVLRGHQGMGIMSALQVAAIERLEQAYGEGNVLIFAEDRAALPSVVASSRRAGLVTVTNGNGEIGAYTLDVEINARSVFTEGVLSPNRIPYGTLVPVVYMGRE